ncbi:MAG TPA: NAD(P)H-binding protein [Streptosporangiaceae bacterium]|nr:NAD(P)H-binding protein [Streptosporangiaceae bacterium]
MTMAAYAVTGASGHVGRFAVQHLLGRGVPASDVVAVVRNRDRAADLAARRVQGREADYSRPDTMATALAGVDREDSAAAAAAALLQDNDGNRTYELGGPSFDLPQLAEVISEITGTKVTYRDLPANRYAAWLEETGLDAASADFVAALDAAIARGDLETSSSDLARLLGLSATPLAEVVRAASDRRH